MIPLEEHEVTAGDVLNRFVARFAKAIEHLPDEEREVVTRAAESVAEGAGVGLVAYGPLRSNLLKKPWGKMGREETRDRMFYDAAEDMAREEMERRDTEPSPAPER